GDTLNYAAEELSKVEGLRRELIANVSHDLRTPLTMISGYGEVMRDLPGENTPENVQIIIDEARRLTSLVNDMLDISKFQSGTQKLHRTRFNLTQAIRDTLGRYNKLTEKDGYAISFASDQEVYVHADELRISQVVYNFINNAITYTGPDKCIYLRQLVEGNSVKIEVRDTGEGIDPDKLQYIWDRYYKVDKAHKRAQIGTGLGLSIVKSILDLHGARYGVKSKTGEGSIFWFELQIDRDPPPEPPADLPS
ncbi:MAG: sensor histidine kinase, partial [Oscillospiraceae bacterium]